MDLYEIFPEIGITQISGHHWLRNFDLILQDAFDAGRKYSKGKVTIYHLLYGLLIDKNDSYVKDLLEEIGKCNISSLKKDLITKLKSTLIPSGEELDVGEGIIISRGFRTALTEMYNDYTTFDSLVLLEILLRFIKIRDCLLKSYCNITKIEDAIENIRLPRNKRISIEDIAQPARDIHTESKELKEEFARSNIENKKLQELIESISNKSQSLTASVKLPPSSMMEITLVPLHQLDRLKEYQDNEAILFLIFGSFFGGFLGYLTNLASNNDGQQITWNWPFFILLILCTLISGIFVWVARNRKKGLAESMTLKVTKKKSNIDLEK